MGAPKVVVVGSANQDLTSYTGVVPVLGQTVMGQTFDTSCGGKGANQAVAAASLGMVPVAMICRVADDVFGKSLLTNFRKCLFSIMNLNVIIIFWQYSNHAHKHKLLCCVVQAMREFFLTKNLRYSPRKMELRRALPQLQ